MKRARFRSIKALEADIPGCRRCKRLVNYCADVAVTKRRAYRDHDYWGRPVPGFGDPKARLLIVGLAPAAHGANRTGRMFTGDSSGDWLYEALHEFGFANQSESTDRNDGLELTDCYISAAGRCAPPGNKPLAEELGACRGYLEAEIRIMHPKVVVVLGRIAWEAYLKASGLWESLAPSKRPPFGHGAEARLVDGTTLISSYHPSRQNTNTGRLTRPMWHRIFRRAALLLSD